MIIIRFSNNMIHCTIYLIKMQGAVNMNHTGKIDILNGKLTSSLLQFAIPIILTGILQQLFNFADTAIVGKFTDSNALAAVGTNGEITALLVTLSAGFSVGVNVRIAYLAGQTKLDRISEIIQTSLMLSLSIGTIIAVPGFIFAGDILRLISVPSEILMPAAAYLRIYLIGLPFLLLYDFGSAILRAFGDSKRPLTAMMVSGLINVILNLFLVTAFQLGVAGVAISTSFSNLISCIFVIYLLVKEGTIKSLKILQFDSSEAMKIITIGTPAAIQGAVFCFANIFVQSAVNTLGVAAVAGSSIAMNFEYLTYYSITAFGQTATTFITQNHAAGSLDRCKKIPLLSMALSFFICLSLTVPIVLFRNPAAGIFSNDVNAINAAALRIIIILALEPICAIYECLAGTIRGLGYSLIPAIITIVGTCLFRIAWIILVFSQVHTEWILYISFPLSWGITSVLMFIAYLMVRKKAETRNRISAFNRSFFCSLKNKFSF